MARTFARLRLRRALEFCEAKHHSFPFGFCTAPSTLAMNLAVLGVDLAVLRADLSVWEWILAVLGVDLPVSGNVAVWKWYFAANFGGEFRFWQ